MIAFILCILLFTYLLIWVNYPCNFHEPRFDGVYSRDNLPGIRSEVFVTDFDECDDIGANSVPIYAKSATYFDIFYIEYILKEIKNLRMIEIF